MNIFIVPSAVSLVVLIGIYLWGGRPALLLVLLVSILEVTLSFDNAVVNAKILGRMDKVWQRRFLTWGILFAVFGTRLVLPALIVGISAFISPFEALRMALYDPKAYAALLDHAKPIISAFGGSFLLMVSLKYFLDREKKVHWIAHVEKRLVKWGRIEAIEIAIALTTIVLLSQCTYDTSASVLTAGCIGILLFIVIQGIANTFQADAEGEIAHATQHISAQKGCMFFVYLNILDAAFSLDGVIGAFALTTMIPVIFAGLGIGAYFVRTITVHLVQKKTLDTLVYLEHGAHWAILGLALSMLASLLIPIPEAITGLVGLVFVTFAYVSSVRNRKHA